MTRIQIVSDLHIDHTNTMESPFESITPSAEILLIAGDTCSLYNFDYLFNYLSTIAPLYKKILFIPGNHEYYTVRGKEKMRIRDLKKCLYFLQERIKNLTIFDRQYIEFGDYILAGCTLWSEFQKEELPKYFRIHSVTAQAYNKFHKHRK